MTSPAPHKDLSLANFCVFTSRLYGPVSRLMFRAPRAAPTGHCLVPACPAQPIQILHTSADLGQCQDYCKFAKSQVGDGVTCSTWEGRLCKFSLLIFLFLHLLTEAHSLLPNSLHSSTWTCGPVCSRVNVHTLPPVFTHPLLWMPVCGARGGRRLCFCASLTRPSFCLPRPVSPRKQRLPRGRNPVHCFLVPPRSFCQLKGPDKQGNLRILMT